MAKTYTMADHEKAFQVFAETRVYQSVADRLEIAYPTAHSWSREDYRCPLGCPWHGWQKLLQAKDQLLATKYALVKQGITDPVEQEVAMAKALDNQGIEGPAREAVRIAAIDEQSRIDQWEYLRNKVFFNATGIALDFREIIIKLKKQPSLTKIDSAQYYKDGLNAKDLESAIRILKECEDRVDMYRGRVNKKAGSEEDDEEEKKPKLDIAQLRQLSSSLGGLVQELPSKEPEKENAG